MDIPISITAVDNASGVLQDVSSSLGSFSNVAVAAAGAAAAAATAVVGFQIAKGLAKEFDANAEALRGLSDAQKAFTADMEKNLGVRDTETAKLMKSAAMYGLQGSQLEAVTKAAIGVSESMGISYDAALQKVINSGTNWQQVQAAATAGLEKKAAIMQTATGAGIAWGNSLAKISQTIGGILSPAVALSTQLSAQFAETINTVLQPALKILPAALEVSLPVFQQFTSVMAEAGKWAVANSQKMFMGVAEAFIGVVTAADIAWNHASEIVTIAADTMHLAVIGLSENIQQLLAYDIELVKWFGENFVNIMRDAAVGAVTIINNMGRNLGEAFFAIFNWMQNGMQGGIEGLTQSLGQGLYVGLLDGFKASTGELPKWIERELTDVEKALADKIAKSGMDLGEMFSEGYAQRLEALKSKLDFSAFTPDGGGLGAMLNKASGMNNDLKATESRLQTRGRADDPMAQQTQLLKMHGQFLQQIVVNTGREFPMAGVADLS